MMANKSGSGRGLFPPSVLTALLIMVMGNVGVLSFSRGGGGGEGMGGCVESEGRALLDLKEGIDPHGTWLSSWREGGDCCGWQGIQCDDVTGHVVELHLRYPYDYPYEAPPSKMNLALISSLPHLRYLDLSRNNFGGGPIPELIGSLAYLEYLNLSDAGFRGIIPQQLGNLSNLQSLDLSVNEGLHGGDPLIWLSKMTSLTHLDLSFTNLSKASSVDLFHHISTIPHLSVLILHGCGLSHDIPTSFPTANNFASLTTVDLSGNHFPSTPIPGWLLNISSLVHLDLSGCWSFRGGLPLPPHGQINNLKYLDLGYNQIGGEILESLERLGNLEYLSLRANIIDASIPIALWNLSHHLKKLDLSYNRLTGEIPDSIGNLRNLETLYLHENQISGSIPNTVGQLRNLTRLGLGGNRIGGGFPEWISNSSHLMMLHLLRNNFTGPVPKSIENLSNLRYLDLSDNRLNGQLPNFNLTQFQLIDISNNSLSGSIHVSLGAIGPNHNSLILNLGRNHLSGRLPLLLCNLTLLSLDLSNNKFYGDIPSCYFNCQDSLDLSNNNLHGEIPSCPNDSTSLSHLHLSNNALSETIPTSFRYLTNLESLNLDNNLISGRIPLSLKYCKQLINLNLNENKLSGNIPTWIGKNLISLRYLSLKSNLLTGYIPVQLSYLSSLQVLDLSNNHLIGHLSLSFEKFSAMNRSHNATEPSDYGPHIMSFGFDLRIMSFGIPEQFELTTKGLPYVYTTGLPAMTSIDLSSNNFHGEIPNGITQLLWLRSLNLSRNNLNGKIPKNIGIMKQLESLDLSVNQLSGGIPTSITEMDFLQHLNLSNNNLSGTIPTGNHLSTFVDRSIYSGNLDLCGWPLPKCSNDGHTHTPTEEAGEDNHPSEIVWTYACVVLGFVVGFWAFIGTIMITRSIRYAYFHNVDIICEWIYVKFVVNVTNLKLLFAKN